MTTIIIKIKDDLHRRLKIKAATDQKFMKEIIIAALEKAAEE